MIYGFIYAGYNEYAINHDKMEGLFYSEINDDAKETYSKIMYYKNEIINVSNLKGSEPNNVIKLEIALLEETINELNLQYKNYLTDISDSNYFSTITYFTIGYGNIVPKGGYLKKIVQSEIYISHLFTVLIIPILLSFIQNQLTNNSEHRKEQEQNRQLETSQ
ncbi:potassium channel family protein [Brassicibacter mesophilus]|uniref:potassium channel family protein n=1 Tax=Brassicibacter mesophilus TaxID=745119 RepID=UPI003D1F114A